MMEMLINANQTFLQQGIALVDRLPPQVFVQVSRNGLASVGTHFRHVLDHYTSFLLGATDGRVDYDARQRDRRVETEPSHAIAVAQAIRRELAAVSSSDSLRVKVDCGAGSPWTTSSVQRELQFLVSHTIHHYAIIRAILAELQIDVADDFGVSPSTLRHRSDSACAH